MEKLLKLLVITGAVLGSHWGSRAIAKIQPAEVDSVYVMVTDHGLSRESSRGHAALRFSYKSLPTFSDEIVNFAALVPDEGSNIFEQFFKGTGLGGHFPSVVTPGNFKGFMKKYEDEKRGVTSYKLRLLPNEKQKLIGFVTAELQAGHASRPFHILRYNCAVMVMEAINQGLDNPIQDRQMNMPDKLGAILNRAGLVSASYYDAQPI